MTINPRTKGKKGEQDIKTAFVIIMTAVEKKLWKKGVSDKVKRNTLQSDRGGDDIVGIPLLSVEVKRHENLSAINTWWAQCKRSASRDKLMPVLIYRQNRKPWSVRSYVWVTCPPYSHGKWVVADYYLEDFLLWYADLYAAWLVDTHSS